MKAMVTIQFVPYGAPIDAVAIDWRTLDLAQSLIDEPKRFGARADFWTRFFELSNLAELFCLQEQLLLVDDDAIARRRAEILSGPISAGTGKGITPFRLFTIDDLQRQRLFRRWELVGRSGATTSDLAYPPDDPDADLGVKPFMAGLAAEEVVGITYFPSLVNAPLLVRDTAVWSDASVYSMLADGYASLRLKEIDRRRWLRAHGAGTRQLPIPPITAVLLSRVSKAEQLVPALVDLRAEFEPLRKKIRELRDLAATGSAADWESEATVIEAQLAKLMREYGDGGTRQEVSQFRPEDATELKTKYRTSTGDEGDFAINLNKLVAMIGSSLLDMFRRRRIKPLPSLKHRLDALPSLTPRIEKLFGVELQPGDLREVERIAKQLQDTWSTVTARRDPERALKTFFQAPRQAFRKGVEALRYSDTFQLERLLREYRVIVRAATEESYSPSDQLVDLGFAFLDEGDIRRAEQRFAKAAELDPENGRATYGLASVADRRKEPEKALALYEKALGQSDDLLLMNDAATFFFNRKEYGRALELFTAVADRDPDYTMIDANLAWTLFRLGRNVEAAEAFDRAVKGVPERGMSHYGRGLVAQALGDQARAIAEWEHAARDRVDNPEAAMHLGMLLRDAARYDAAVEAFESARDVDAPEKALMMIASTLYLAERYAEASAAFAELDQLTPDDPDAKRLWAFALYSSGDREEALQRFREAADLDPQNPMPLEAVVEILFELDRVEEGMVALDALLDHGSTAGLGAEYLYRFGLRCDEVRELPRAVRCYQRALTLGGDDHRVLSNLGVDLAELGRPADGMPYVERACALAPDDPVDWNNLAVLAAQLEDYGKAAEAMQHVVDLGGGPAGPEYARQALDELRRAAATYNP